MGNECCRVKHNIDEEEELRNPFEPKEISYIQKPKLKISNDNCIQKNDFINFEAIPEDIPLNGTDIMSNYSKEYSKHECLIQNEYFSADEEEEKVISSETETAKNENSIDIISQSSILSFE